MIKNQFRILSSCNTWKDFETALRPLGKKEKGDCFELFTKYYLSSNPKYSTQLKEVWFLREVPSNIRAKLSLPDTDEGIDLVAETKDGKYWAIQCKYREDTEKSLTRRELSTFTDLAFNICKNIEFCLVCTTAERFSRKLKMHDKRLSFCSGNEWRALDGEFFRNIHQRIAHRPVSLIPKKPKLHQKKAIDNAYEHFIRNGNTRGKLIMPCATGKSLVGYWIAEKLGAKHIIVAVPSLALIKQTLEVWSREALAQGHEIQWIAVCSDESVGDQRGDEAIVLTQDLGLAVHTDPHEIAGWLKEHISRKTIVFTTYQSGKAVAAAARKVNFLFDIGILDEAHKTAGRKNSLFSHLLFDKNVKIKKRIFMTATERRYRGTTDEIISMDNPDIYGGTFECLSFKNALKASPPILTDYKVITMCVGRDEVRDLIQKNKLIIPDRGRWNKEIEAEMFATMIAYRKALEKYPIKHAVSFHSSILRAKQFSECQDTFGKAFPNSKAVKTFHVSGKQPTAIRDRVMNEFASSRRALVSNARCLTEGVDVPDIDCVVFADPRKSTIDVVQAVGRALRIADGKKFGYVIVPVLIDAKGVDIQKGAYDDIMIVLRALASNDERVVEYFRTISQGRQWKDGRNPVQIDVPLGISINAESFVKSVQLRVWSKLAKLSWRPFEEAKGLVQDLGFHNQDEWNSYAQGKLHGVPPKPADIPSQPWRNYQSNGWVSMGDWLGTGTISTQLLEHLSFSEARDIVRALNLKRQTEWHNYYQKSHNKQQLQHQGIPRNPQNVYRAHGWKNWGDWLGTESVSKKSMKTQMRPFIQARAFVHKLKLRGADEWRLYCKKQLDERIKPTDIPATPDRLYKNHGWKDWGDWLGTGHVAPFNREFYPYERARAFVHKLKLINTKEWNLYCQGKFKNLPSMPEYIPKDPRRYYEDKGWESMGAWLGTNIVANQFKKYHPFKQARSFVHKLKLRSAAEWRLYCKGKLKGQYSKPEDIPADPQQRYKDTGWISWGDWLGTGSISYRSIKFRSFKKARAFVRKQNLKNQVEWFLYCTGKKSGNQAKPNDIPSAPHRQYKNAGWAGWRDWLGTDKQKAQ